MSTLSEQSRARAKDKLTRLMSKQAGAVDASGWKENTEEKGNVQTGMRPLSRRAFKAGGLVAAGSAPEPRADRKPRAKGGGLVDDLVNVEMKKANDLRDGEKHEGGLKAGGRAKKMMGGPMMGRAPMMRPNVAAPTGIRPQIGMRPMLRKSGGKVHDDAAADKRLIASEMHKAGCGCGKCSGGKVGYASGGRTKKAMNVNIIIAQSPKPALAAPVAPPPMGGAGPVGLHQGAPPPVAAPAPMQPPTPGAPMMRKSGGRTYPIKTGGGGGLARLAKARAYG